MKSFSYDDVFQASLNYFNGDELAASVFAKKYCLQNEDNYYELTPDDMHRRLAKEFARIEANYPNPMTEEEIYNSLKEFKRIVPQGSPMSAIGNPFQIQSLSNCFVIPPAKDSYAGILHTDQQEAQIMKRRGGVGHDISNIRPKGLLTKNAAKTTDGIGVFMERFSNTCNEVAQKGRRGALILTISCHHPEIFTFINIKRDRKKVTGANISIRFTDEFFEAVDNNAEYELRWPVDSKNPEVSEMISAKKVWDAFIDASWDNAEPGGLFWDTVQRRTPADIYAEEGFKSTSTNPCSTYETKVAVADGRGLVSIGDLAKEGKDVPVFAVDENNKICVKTMRHPRITGYDKDVYKVTVEGGHSFKATPNHKMFVNGKGYVEIKDLQVGDSLQTFYKKEASIKDIFPKANSNSQDYFWWKSPKVKALKSDHRLIWEFYNGETPKGHVIHHIDHDAQNNNIDNLQCMTIKDHNELHAKDMMGENNPIHKIKKDPVKWANYLKAQSEAHSGENNHRYSGKTHEDLRLHAIKLTQKLGRRYSIKDWVEYAKENSLPQGFSKFRKDELGSILELAFWAAQELSIEFINEDPRVVKTLASMEEQGYEARIENNKVLVKKVCEKCSSHFEIDHRQREVAFCSKKCSLEHVNSNKEIAAKRNAGITAFVEKKAEKTKEAQLLAYTKLKFELGRKPKMKEWEQECASNGIPHRVGRTMKHGFKSYSEVVEQGENYNHRVVSIEYAGKETVYNGTVDDVHNFVMGGFEEVQNNGKKQWAFFNNLQCGEILLSNYDSCRLLLLNTMSFVNNPFTSEASFDFELFGKEVQKAQRLMDDLVDLEIESVDKIIEKVKSDPEPDDIKKIELDLWSNIRDAAVRGRRTGLGVTAIGDTVAKLGMTYGSPESIAMVESIYKALALNAYRSSCILAKERGSFPVYNFEKEEGHEFMEQIFEADPELRELHRAHGRRNIALTTTAPCGSVSIETQSSSGIEPVFMVGYKRRKKVNPEDTDSRVDFVDDLGVSWQEYMVYHHGVEEWMRVTGETDVTKSPYHGGTANEIDWEAGVEVQAAAQKWICHAISRTTNLPKEATREDVANIYMRGWKSGCKGMTVYRDGSRSGVLVSEDDTGSGYGTSKEGRPTKIPETHAPKRPEELPCEIHHVTVKGTPWVVILGMMGENPYEIFMGTADTLSLPKKAQLGRVKKVKKGQYDLYVDLNDDELVVKNLVKVFDNPEGAWATRMISMSLRHGAPIDFIVEQLGKDGGMTDVNRVLSRILKKFIKDGAKVKTSNSCPSCESDSLVFMEGCMTCTSCGWSKCS